MTIRLGTLGPGLMGRHHVRNARAAEGVEFVALADLAGDWLGVVPSLEVLPGVEDLIVAGIDTTIVAVLTTFHGEAALLLAEAGMHTLVEKPLSVSVESGRRIAEAFRRADLVGAVGYVEHCNPALVEVRRKIVQGQLGEAYQTVARRQSLFPARISDVGVAKDLATHDVDLISWVVGAPYEMMFAQVGYRSGRVYEDLLLASGRLANGVLVNHQVNWPTPYKDRTTIVIGEHGALVAGTAMGDLSSHESGSLPLQWEQTAALQGVSEGTVIRYALDRRESLAVEYKHFRDAILRRGGEHVSMVEGARILEVLEGTLKSARTGQVVRFSEWDRAPPVGVGGPERRFPGGRRRRALTTGSSMRRRTGGS